MAGPGGRERRGPGRAAFRASSSDGVLERGPHPRADRLSVCQVEVGRPAPVRIVLRRSRNVGPPARWFPVGAARVRPCPTAPASRGSSSGGVLSEGMICSEAELGLGEDARGHPGAARGLPRGIPHGGGRGAGTTSSWTSRSPRTGPDCLSVAGVAREVAALTGARLRLPVPRAVRERRAGGRLHRGGDRGRRGLSSLRGPDPAPGRRRPPRPGGFRTGLRAVGQRPVNNIVDVTNFVMLELGQPAPRLRTCIGCRKAVSSSAGARPGEALRDPRRQRPRTRRIGPSSSPTPAVPVALAGVMGGAESEVHRSDKRRLLLEAAHFSPRRVRSLCSRLGIRTEASFRFERGVDWGPSGGGPAPAPPAPDVQRSRAPGPPRDASM